MEEVLMSTKELANTAKICGITCNYRPLDPQSPYFKEDRSLWKLI